MSEDRTQAQDAVIAFLSQPEAYGVPGPVERIDTHGAIVFLAGDRVFKLKRAVRYAYLDFSTAEKRRAVCEEELRLNRRTAPDLYLEMRSVNAQADGAVGFGPGEPVDWLVVMRRFDAADLLDAVAARDELDAPLIRALADEIAAFHKAADIVATAGGAERVRTVIEGNRASMADCDAAILPRAQCDRLCEASLDVLAKVAALLDGRGIEGHVRHCHGDLHLANICLWKGRPTLFDCLEFDAELATTDVLYDLAFLVMDLWRRGLRAQASLLFNRYLDMTDEGAGVAAFPLFLSMRAAIRAHVEAKAAGLQDDPREAERHRASARAYLAAALAFLEPPAPRLVAIGGLSGTGKSTLAGLLAPDIGGAPGARWLRTDVLRKRLAGVAPERPLPAEAYAPGQSARVYQRLVEEAAAHLDAGRSVIVDGVFARPEERARIGQVAAGQGAPFAGIWLEAPEALLTARVSARSGDASDADAAVVARQLDYRIGDLGRWRRIDASSTPDEVRASVLRAIAEA